MAVGDALTLNQYPIIVGGWHNVLQCSLFIAENFTFAHNASNTTPLQRYGMG